MLTEIGWRLANINNLIKTIIIYNIGLKVKSFLKIDPQRCKSPLWKDIICIQDIITQNIIEELVMVLLSIFRMVRGGRNLLLGPRFLIVRKHTSRLNISKLIINGTLYHLLSTIINSTKNLVIVIILPFNENILDKCI